MTDALLLLLVALVGWASYGELERDRRRIDDLSTRLDALAKQVHEMRTEGE